LHSAPHVPFTHVRVPFVIAGHGSPHVLQLSTSALKSTQRSPQRVVGGLQRKPQARASQKGVAFAGALQTTPQPPQFDASVVTSMQEAPQGVSAPQSRAHWPPLQRRSPLQTFVQLPQWRPSDWVSTHSPSHSVWPALHAMRQARPSQVTEPFAGGEQTLPHCPQFDVSESSFTQAAAQGE
jgi:hypothetical protein